MNVAAGRRTFPWRVRQRRAAEAARRELTLWTVIGGIIVIVVGRSEPIAVVYALVGLALLHAVAIELPYRRSLSRGDDRKLGDFVVTSGVLLCGAHLAACGGCVYYGLLRPSASVVDRFVGPAVGSLFLFHAWSHVRRLRRLRLERLVLRRGRHLGTSAFARGTRERAYGSRGERRPASAYRLRRQRREAYGLSAELLAVLFLVGASWALALAASFVVVGAGLALGILAALAALIVLAALWLARVARPETRATAILDFVIIHRACLCCAYVAGTGAVFLGATLLVAESGPGALGVVVFLLVPVLPLAYRHRRGWNRARLERIVIEARGGGGGGEGVGKSVGLGERAGLAGSRGGRLTVGGDRGP